MVNFIKRGRLSFPPFVFVPIDLKFIIIVVVFLQDKIVFLLYVISLILSLHINKM